MPDGGSVENILRRSGAKIRDINIDKRRSIAEREVIKSEASRADAGL